METAELYFYVSAFCTTPRPSRSEENSLIKKLVKDGKIPLLKAVMVKVGAKSNIGERSPLFVRLAELLGIWPRSVMEEEKPKTEIIVKVQELPAKELLRPPTAPMSLILQEHNYVKNKITVPIESEIVSKAPSLSPLTPSSVTSIPSQPSLLHPLEVASKIESESCSDCAPAYTTHTSCYEEHGIINNINIHSSYEVKLVKITSSDEAKPVNIPSSYEVKLVNIPSSDEVKLVKVKENEVINIPSLEDEVINIASSEEEVNISSSDEVKLVNISSSEDEVVSIASSEYEIVKIPSSDEARLLVNNLSSEDQVINYPSLEKEALNFFSLEDVVVNIPRSDQLTTTEVSTRKCSLANEETSHKKCKTGHGITERWIVRNKCFAKQTGGLVLCEVCSKTFVSLTEVRNHKNKAHKNDPRLRISRLIKRLSSQVNVAQTSGIHVVKIGREYRIKESLVKHNVRSLKVKSTGKGSEISCAQCDRKCKSKKSLQKHIGRFHNAKSTVPCPEKCGKMLTTKDAIKKHLLSHRPRSEWPVACPLCSKRFQARADIPKHLLSAKHKEENLPVVGSPEWLSLVYWEEPLPPGKGERSINVGEKKIV